MNDGKNIELALGFSSRWKQRNAEPAAGE